MLILPPYSRREDERAAKQFKFSGLRNNLEEIITGFFQKLPRKNSHSYRKDEVYYVIIIGWSDNASSGTWSKFEAKIFIIGISQYLNEIFRIKRDCKTIAVSLYLNFLISLARLTIWGNE